MRLLFLIYWSRQRYYVNQYLARVLTPGSYTKLLHYGWRLRVWLFAPGSVFFQDTEIYTLTEEPHKNAVLSEMAVYKLYLSLKRKWNTYFETRRPLTPVSSTSLNSYREARSELWDMFTGWYPCRFTGACFLDISKNNQKPPTINNLRNH